MSKVVKKAFGKVKEAGSSVKSTGKGALGLSRGTAGQTRDIDKGDFEIKDYIRLTGEAAGGVDRSKARSELATQRSEALTQQLIQQASGEGPSLAEAQLKSASDRNLAQQLAAAQSQRGGSASATQRNLARSQSLTGREVAQDATAARLQERQAAQQQLGQTLAQEQQAQDQLTQQYIQMGFSMEEAQAQGRAQWQKMMTSQNLTAQGISASAFESAQSRRGAFAKNIGEAATSASDKRAKKNIKKSNNNNFGKELGKAFGSSNGNSEKEKASDSQAKSQLKKSKTKKTHLSDPVNYYRKPNTNFSSMMSELSDKQAKKDMKEYSDKNVKKDFLDKLQAYTYEYKDSQKDKPLAGHGRYMSVMAQDLEKAGPIGASMVSEDEEGTKVVDYGKGFGAILAAQTHLNKRLEELENKKSKK